MGPNYVLDKGYSAATALTQFNVVRFSTKDACTASTTAGEAVLGVVQETVPTADASLTRPVNVRILGITRVVVTTGATITVGTAVRSNGDGTVTTLAATTANQNVVGIALTAVSSAAAGSQIDLLLTPGAQRST